PAVATGRRARRRRRNRWADRRRARIFAAGDPARGVVRWRRRRPSGGLTDPLRRTGVVVRGDRLRLELRSSVAGAVHFNDAAGHGFWLWRPWVLRETARWMARVAGPTRSARRLRPEHGR